MRWTKDAAGHFWLVNLALQRVRERERPRGEWVCGSQPAFTWKLFAYQI